MTSRFAGTSEKDQIQCSLGKAAYTGGTGESVASSSFSAIIPLFGVRCALCLLPGSLLSLSVLPQPHLSLLDPARVHSPPQATITEEQAAVGFLLRSRCYLEGCHLPCT